MRKNSKLLATSLFFLFNSSVQAGGGATGGATEPTQIMNNTQLLMLKAQQLQNYATMIERLKIMTQNAQTGGIKSISPSELMYVADGIQQMAAVTNASNAQTAARIRQMQAYAPKGAFVDGMTLEQINQRNNDIRDKQLAVKAEAMSQLGLVEADMVNRQAVRAKIKGLISDPNYGAEKAIRVMQLLAEQQSDISDRQLAVQAAALKAQQETEALKDTKEDNERILALRYMGFKMANETANQSSVYTNANQTGVYVPNTPGNAAIYSPSYSNLGGDSQGVSDSGGDSQ
jgi:hypothetical protein